MKKLLYSLACVAAFLSLQGCFFWHTTDHEKPVEHTSTTVVSP
jgi:hypothetical protein